MFHSRSFRFGKVCTAGGGGGGGPGGKEGGEPSMLRLANEGNACLPTVRTAWRPSGAGGRCFRGRRGGRGDRPASPSGTVGGDLDGAPCWRAPLARRRRRRRGRGADAGVEEDGGAGSLSRSTSSLALVLPPFITKVSVAESPASLASWRSLFSSPSIFFCQI